MNNPSPDRKPQDVKATTPSLPDPERELMPAFAKEQAAKVFGKVPLLGAVVWLMMQQSGTRHTLLSDLEWRVMPALVLDQAKIYLRDNAPIAFVSWAKMSEASALRYQTAPHHLVAADWQSGDQIWIIDLLAPFGGAQEVMNDLRRSVFPDQTLHHLKPPPPPQ